MAELARIPLLSSPWGLLAAIVVVVLLVVVGYLVVRRLRARPAAAPAAPAPRPLADVWSDLLREARADARAPLVVLLGDRLAGKSRLAQAGLARGAGSPLLAAGGADDPRLTLHAGRDVVVQEISGELLDD